MWTRALLKKNGKEAFKRNYWLCVLVSGLAALLCGGLSIGSNTNYSMSQEEINSAFQATTPQEILAQIPLHIMFIFAVALIIAFVVAIVYNIFVANVVTVGHIRYYLENREHKTSVGTLFYSFQEGRYGKTVLTLFLRGLYVLGWTLLFVIPGIIKAYAYSMVPYIMAENPSMDKGRVFELSEQMMKGHKWEAFKLGLSFFGWIFLGVFTYGLSNIFFTQPYVAATMVEFYSALKAEARMKGLIMNGELSERIIVTEDLAEDLTEVIDEIIDEME